MTMKQSRKVIKRTFAMDSGIEKRQYIYMERSYNKSMNNVVVNNLGMLEALFASRGAEFIYLPKVAEPLRRKGCMEYIVPSGRRREMFATSDVYAMLFNGVDGMPDNPFIMQYCDDGNTSVVHMWELDNSGGEILFECATEILSYKYNEEDKGAMPAIPHEPVEPEACMAADVCGYTHYSAAEEEWPRKKSNLNRYANNIFHDFKEAALYEEEDASFNVSMIAEETPARLPITVQWETSVQNVGADELFNEIMESDQYLDATNKIYEAVEQLHRLGIGQLVIRSIAHRDNSLSRIRIDDNYDITLPDYNEMAIEMAPMTKAVFLLFLRHEEGIIFKDLPDYRDELQALYWDMVDSNDAEEIKAKVERVTNPFSNAINEHCSRIKAAFALKFDDSLASSYYINGRRGEPKRISLPRSLVEWEMM